MEKLTYLGPLPECDVVGVGHVERGHDIEVEDAIACKLLREQPDSWTRGVIEVDKAKLVEEEKPKTSARTRTTRRRVAPNTKED